MTRHIEECPDLVRKDLVRKDLVRKDLVRKDLVRKILISSPHANEYVQMP
jgi:hypothetical protein